MKHERIPGMKPIYIEGEHDAGGRERVGGEGEADG